MIGLSTETVAENRVYGTKRTSHFFHVYVTKSGSVLLHHATDVHGQRWEVSSIFSEMYGSSQQYDRAIKSSIWTEILFPVQKP